MRNLGSAALALVGLLTFFVGVPVGLAYADGTVVALVITLTVLVGGMLWVLGVTWSALTD